MQYIQAIQASRSNVSGLNSTQGPKMKCQFCWHFAFAKWDRKCEMALSEKCQTCPNLFHFRICENGSQMRNGHLWKRSILIYFRICEIPSQMRKGSLIQHANSLLFGSQNTSIDPIHHQSIQHLFTSWNFESPNTHITNIHLSSQSIPIDSPFLLTKSKLPTIHSIKQTSSIYINPIIQFTLQLHNEHPKFVSKFFLFK